MSRLIVHSEVVYGQFRKSPNEANISPVVAVSVTSDNGEPLKGLGSNSFKIYAIIPPPAPPKFQNLTVFSVDEQKPGLYVLGLAFSKVPAPSGKYIFSVKVSKKPDLGETLTTWVMP